MILQDNLQIYLIFMSKVQDLNYSTVTRNLLRISDLAPIYFIVNTVKMTMARKQHLLFPKK